MIKIIKRQLVIGIDGGGTKTHLILSDSQGVQLTEAFGGPSNLMAYAPETVRENLSALLHPILEGLSADQEISAICLGSAGISLSGACEFLEGTLKEICPTADVVVLGDMEIALYANSTSCGGQGILLICGTGSICFGKGADGAPVRAGGWGHVVSDEGSGYWIGMEAIKYVFHVVDGRAEMTSLYTSVLEELNCKTPKELITLISSPTNTKSRIANVCKVVEDCAIMGNNYAIFILNNAAKELVKLVQAVATRLSFSSGYSVFLNGSVITKCKPLRVEFLRLLGEQSQVLISDVTIPAAYGAVKVLINNIK